MSAVVDLLARLLNTADRRALARALVDRLGPGNRNKAFRRVHALVDDGACPPDLAERLLQAFPEDREALSIAIEQTRAERVAQRHAAMKALFRPHLFIRTERSRPRQITMFGLSGGVDRWLKLPLPEDIAERGTGVQRRLVREAVEAHAAECGEGHPVFSMGRTVGYLYRPRYEQSYAVSLDGRIVSGDQGLVNEPQSGVSIG
ncbi:hypothetical protein KBTX_03072 [wastewater metagenome]|uniref:Uncharacterized protein n=2 Tax=unclassified sequences TaxID=12908 RepID=A0A5B8RDQ8_9ZZZZ|nr:hypothetical protein KBTEX_03072 [uncultured organism]